jgi:predicted nucleic acid-binding protein
VRSYFFDTYAMIEIYYGNPNYKCHLDDGVITTKLNLMEVYYHMLREHGEKVANKYYDANLHYAVDILDSDIKDAMKFRMAQKTKWNISYVDAIGYTMAKRMKVKFLTGDMAFEKMANVEYVK